MADWESIQKYANHLLDWEFCTAVEYNGGLKLEDVVGIVASHEGTKEDWAWLVQMKDGFIFARGGCDYTGWD